jgi:hypothetical protein
MALQTRVPDSDVDTSDWTGSAGGTKALLIDETIAAQDGNTTYVQNNSGFNVFLLCQSSSTVSASAVASVTVRVHAIIGANTPQMSVRLRVNGTAFEITGAVSLTGSYATYEDTWTTNPDTAASWVVNDVNGSGAAPIQGFGCRAEDGARVTAIELVVDYTPSGGGSSVAALSYYRRRRRQ